jgi:hypothetical protein
VHTQLVSSSEREVAHPKTSEKIEHVVTQTQRNYETSPSQNSEPGESTGVSPITLRFGVYLVKDIVLSYFFGFYMADKEKMFYK